MSTTLIAFHGEPAIKEKYLARLRAHAAADEIIHGQYWEHGKGCAVGCTIHDDQHSRYESELGIPAAIAHLEDAIFEALPNGEAKTFPARFLEAIPVGADLSMVIPRFLYWLFADETFGLINATTDSPDDVKAAVQAVGECYRRRIAGDEPTEAEWEAAGQLARDAWDAWDARASLNVFASPLGSASRRASAEKLLELLAAAVPRAEVGA